MMLKMYFHLIKSFFIVGLLTPWALVSGCMVQPQVAPEEGYIVVQPHSIPYPPVFFEELHQDSCEGLNLTDYPLTSATIYSLNLSQIEAVAVDFERSNTVGTNSLSSRYVERTIYNSKWQRKGCGINIASRFQPCLDPKTGKEIPYTLIDEGKPLQVCDSSSDYERESAESVALTTMHFLNTSAEKFSRVYRGEPDIPKVTLEIFPEFESIFTDVDPTTNESVLVAKYDVQNLSYIPKYKKIVVYPPLKISSNTVYLPDSMFPTFHEMGHHVEFSTSKKNRSCEIENKSAYPSLTNTPPNIGSMVCGAESEALADMLAFSTKIDLSDHLQGLPCLGATRDARSDTFKNGDRKIMDDRVIDIFYGRRRFNIFNKEDIRVVDKDNNVLNPCEIQNYQEIHTIGAILAQHFLKFNDIAAKKIGFRNNVDRSDFDYYVTVEMMKLLNKNFEKYKGIERLYYIYDLALNQYLALQKTPSFIQFQIKSEICSHAKEIASGVIYKNYRSFCRN